MRNHIIRNMRRRNGERIDGRTDLRQWRVPLCCALGSILIYGLLTNPFLSKKSHQPIRTLDRESYGGMEKQVPVVISGAGDNPVRYTVGLQPREYTAQEAQAVFESVMERIGDIILRDNVSLTEIRGDLNLISGLEAEGIRLRWQTDLPEYLNHQGVVMNEEIPDSGAAGHLELQMSAGEYKADYHMPIRILPQSYDSQPDIMRGLAKELKRLDQEQAEQSQLVLPDEFEGQNLRFYPDEETDYRAIPVIGLVAAVLLLLRTRDQEKNRQKEREQQLLLDYSELLTKLMVFIGAGMTVRLAWERIVNDYQSGLTSGSRKPRHVYEEMRHTGHQMQSGVPEGKAYQEFGERCRLQPYLKLSSLLEQNRKTGMKNMRELMRKEVDDAFEQRKHLVRRLGEEAGTKLTAPLFLMLGVVMVMVLFPAMMNMR